MNHQVHEVSPNRRASDRRIARGLAVLYLLVVLAMPAIAQRPNPGEAGLAPKPPMGWASWNRFFCDYDERMIMEQVDAIVANGIRDAGYKYVIIQECIAPARDSSGELEVDAKRFPHGLKSLVEYIHAHGLLAGIYTDIGPNTCFGDPKYQGSYDHEDQDARTFAKWGFDLIEVDYCNKPANHPGRELYERMANGIRKTGRPMLLYICTWGSEQPWEWAQSVSPVWRTEQDISWEKNHVSWEKIVANFESNARHSVLTGPNSWNDPDMLEVGMPGISNTEARSHFLMWAISAAPLWVGADLTAMSAETRAILTNPEVIAVDQDPLGAGPHRVAEDTPGVEIWRKPLRSQTSGKEAILMLNLTASPVEAEVEWSDLGLEEVADVRDLTARRDLGKFMHRYMRRLAPHEAVLLLVSGKFSWKRLPEYEAEWPGNDRVGNAQLVNCGECSSGYAISLAAQPDSSASALIFNKLDVSEDGDYTATLFFARSAQHDQLLQMRVNDTNEVTLTLPPRAYGWVSFHVHLRAGENELRLRSAGKDPVLVDVLKLSH